MRRAIYWSMVLAALTTSAHCETAWAQTEARPSRTASSDCLAAEAFAERDVPLASLDLSFRAQADRLPEDCSTRLFASGVEPELQPEPPEFEMTWAASELFHQPLYFDDTLLERYGQSAHPLVQPILSGAHFFGTFPIVPYKIGVHRTHDRIYTLAYYRPGSPMPCLGRRLPLEADAAFFETATWLPLIFLLP